MTIDKLNIQLTNNTKLNFEKKNLDPFSLELLPQGPNVVAGSQGLPKPSSLKDQATIAVYYANIAQAKKMMINNGQKFDTQDAFNQEKAQQEITTAQDALDVLETTDPEKARKLRAFTGIITIPSDANPKVDKVKQLPPPKE